MEDRKEYYGYTVTSKGQIFDSSGKEVRTQSNGRIVLNIDGKKHVYSTARVVWEAFAERPLDKKEIVIFLSDNDKSFAISNLAAITRKEYYETHTTGRARKLSEQKVKEIKEKYNYEERKKHNFQGEYAHPSYQDLANEYQVCKSTIIAIVKGVYYTKQRKRRRVTKKHDE